MGQPTLRRGLRTPKQLDESATTKAGDNTSLILTDLTNRTYQCRIAVALYDVKNGYTPWTIVQNDSANNKANSGAKNGTNE
jgi:hypothetical protein